MHHKKVKELLNKGISDSPLMLHGTGLASLLKLNETGALPVNRLPEKQTQDYLYFAPVRKKFVKTKFYNELKGCTPNWALRTAEAYAHIHAHDEYIAKELVSAGISSKYANYLMLEFAYGFKFAAPIKERLKALKLGKPWWSKTYSAANNIKSGIIIEANESILELKLGIDPDDEGLRVFCPNGLDISYIRGIEILNSII